MLSGNCIKCQGALCISGHQICCAVCGTPQADHPATIEMQKMLKASQSQPAPAPVIPAQEYVASWGDRINALEKQAVQQQARIDQLEAQLRELSKEVKSCESAKSEVDEPASPAPKQHESKRERSRQSA